MLSIRMAAVAALVTVGVAGATYAQAPVKVITEADCTAAKLGTEIPVAAIKEPVSAVTLNTPQWRAAAGSVPAYCSVEGSMAPIDKAAKPILFGVALPASWMDRATQLGGGGMNGTIPRLTGTSGKTGPSFLERGFATYGSDSGHQSGMPPMPAGVGRGGAPPQGGAPVPPRAATGAPEGRGAGPGGMPGPGMGMRGPMDPTANEWTLNDEAVKNLAFLQLKKTHDAAMVLIERMYGKRPKYNYFFGNSQGGREALTVAQRYPADYDGISAEVPIVSFSTLMLAPEFIRIKEKPVANWVTPAKVNAIRAEFMRQCDALDGLTDGVINNYQACRAIFDISEGAPNRHPWTAKRCPGNVDPNPEDTSAGACLTDGQMATLELVYSRYKYATPLANNSRTFGMWVPNTDPSGSGLISAARYRGQEGVAADGPVHFHMGVLGVTGFLMRDLAANPLDYVEGGPLNARREALSSILDSTNPDLSAFQKRGGKLIVAIGTNDTLASPGAQLDYYQAVLDKMGRPAVDAFARLFVLPQTDHGLSGRTYSLDGTGKEVPVQAIPSVYPRVDLLVDWVERGKAPEKAIVATAGDRTLPMCSYPEFPRYVSGAPGEAGSYRCAAK
jgi:hypothetical protein